MLSDRHLLEFQTATISMEIAQRNYKNCASLVNFNISKAGTNLLIALGQKYSNVFISDILEAANTSCLLKYESFFGQCFVVRSTIKDCLDHPNVDGIQFTSKIS